MVIEYRCKICDNVLTGISYIALIKYRNPEVIPIESVVSALKEKDFVCNRRECKLEMADLLSEGYRDRDTFLLALEKEALYSNCILSDLEKKMIAELIEDYENFCYKYKASQLLEQTKQDKSIGSKLIQGNLFHKLEENH